MSSERRYGIGYALAPKKTNSFIQDSLVELSRARGIDLICIDDKKPLVDQGPFDCVLHKLTGDKWRKELEEYSLRYPNVFILDRPEAIERLHNRISMLQVVSELKIRQENEEDMETETFGIPKQIVVEKAEGLSDFRTLEGRLKFPVIAKPLVVDGSVKSHKMSLVFNSDGLLKLNPPLVLQEFVNHGGVIFKVYVVGDYVKCVKRKSLPDVPEEKLESSEGSLSFCHVSNVTHDQKNEGYLEVMHLEKAVLPPGRFIGRIAEELRKALGLYLFNFDVIRDTSVGNRYLVIDINYFPGYAKMPVYESVLTDFFCKIFHGKVRLESSAIEGFNLNHTQPILTRDEGDIEKSTDAEFSRAVIKDERLGKEDDADEPSMENLARDEDSLSATIAKLEDSSRETIDNLVDTLRETLVSADNSLNDKSEERVPHMNAGSNAS